MNKAIPKINTQLRSHTILVPEVYREATGVLINGKRIKSLVCCRICIGTAFFCIEAYSNGMLFLSKADDTFIFM